MKLTLLLAMVITLPASAQTAHWEYSVSTGGENVSWISPTAVNPLADQFQFVNDITYVAVDVVFLGIVFGPIEVTQDLDPLLLHGEGVSDGPAPILFMDAPISTDADLDGDIDMAANVMMQLNGKGHGQLDITNVFLGDVLVDMGFPFGMQLVQIDRIYIAGQIDVTEIVIPCPEDTNGDGTIDVTDILTVIANWGGTGNGDVTGDGTVDVADILAIVGAWGPC